VEANLKVRRLWEMMIGNIESKENFKYLTKHGVRSLGSMFISKEPLLNKLVDIIPDDLLTGFQLIDILD
jgi:hypothetical protein